MDPAISSGVGSRRSSWRSVSAVRMMRESLIEVLDSSYVLMARLKGLPTWRVLLFHALPNALGPAINITALNVAWMIGGVVVVEAVFEFPGIGRLMIDSIFARDYAVVQGLTIVLAVLVSVVFLLVDTVQAMLDPRQEPA